MFKIDRIKRHEKSNEWITDNNTVSKREQEIEEIVQYIDVNVIYWLQCNVLTSVQYIDVNAMRHYTSYENDISKKLSVFNNPTLINWPKFM